MKIKKNLFFSAIAFTCIIAMSFSVSAINESTTTEVRNNNSLESIPLYEGDFDIAEAKNNLAALHEDEYEQMSDEEIQENLNGIEKILFADISEEDRQLKLQEMNVYILEVPEENQSKYEASKAEHVSLNAPVIYYNAKNKYWGIYASGRFNTFPDDLNWTSVFWPTKGKRYDIGDVDCYGFAIVDTDSGKYNATLKSQKCIISTSSSPASGTQVISTSKTTGSGKYGIGFQVQDKALITKWSGLTYTWKYIGYSFGCIGWYTDSFKNYRGNVETVYAHTYSNCEIKDFTIGADVGYSSSDGGELGANCAVSFYNASKGYTASSSQTNLYDDGFKLTKKDNPVSAFNP